MRKLKIPHDEDYEFEEGKSNGVLGAHDAGKTRLSFKVGELNEKES